MVLFKSPFKRADGFVFKKKIIKIIIKKSIREVNPCCQDQVLFCVFLLVCLFLFFTEVSVTNFPTVPSSTIFWKQHVLVACMILLVLLPSALTRLHGCCPRAFLWWHEDLLLPQVPWMAKRKKWEHQDLCSWGTSSALMPQLGWGQVGTPAFLGSLHGLCTSDPKGCCFSLAIGKF